MLAVIDDEDLCRDIKGTRNLQEGRHALAENVFHGRKGQLFQRYYQGMEDQLGTLGIVLNCLVLWNTVYIDEALRTLRAQGYQVRDEDMARLGPFIRNTSTCAEGTHFIDPNQVAAVGRCVTPRRLMTPTTRSNPTRCWDQVREGRGGDDQDTAAAD
jgi:hypothetical protein